MKRNSLVNDLARTWVRFCELYPQLNLADPPIIIFNDRLRTTAAQIRTEIRQIEINRKMYVTNRKEYLEILIPHEVAHMVDVDLHGETETDHHRPSWQDIMIRFGIPPDQYHKIKY